MDDAFPAPRLVETNGVRLAVHEAGPPDSRAPPIVLCHGFPDLAFAWRRQLPTLAEAGYRALAPDMRGYGRSDCPAPVEAYALRELLADLVGLLDADGIERAVFCGHDWGGAVVWAMGQRHPDRVAGVIGLNTPYRHRGPLPPTQFMRKTLGEAFYMLRFQEPGWAEALFEADVKKTVRYFLRRPHAADGIAGMATTLEAALASYDPADDPHQFLSPRAIAFYAEAFTRTGYRGGLNWYRNLDRNWADSAGLTDHVSAPSLMIMADKDAVLPPSAADGMERFVPNLDKALVVDSGHWTQQEQPDAVNQLILDWLARTIVAPR